MHAQTILRFPHLAATLGISRATIYRLLKSDPTFPRPVTLSARAVGFFKVEVESWLEQRRVTAPAAKERTC